MCYPVTGGFLEAFSEFGSSNRLLVVIGTMEKTPFLCHLLLRILVVSCPCFIRGLDKERHRWFKASDVTCRNGRK